VKVNYISLGCPKNAVDLEKILGSLAPYVDFTEHPDEADMTIINTCAFIQAAQQEAIDEILNIAQIKQERPDFQIWVTGCLPQRYKNQLLELMPEIDEIFTHRDADETSTLICKKLTGTSNRSGKRYPITASHYRYLTIAQGCNNRCSYCAIPVIKGDLKSRTIPEILAEAHHLANSKDSPKELILVAQDTTAFGMDRNGQELSNLLIELDKKRYFDWIRIMYTHPAHWNEGLMDVLANADTILPYIDMPVQHINDKILKSMKRSVTGHDIRALIDKLREKINPLVLRTSLIVGYPGESKHEFNELLAFVENTEFDRLGVFTYSKEQDTRAFNLSNTVSEKTKHRRQEEIMMLQAEISYHKNQKLLHSGIKVLVDEYDKDNHQSIGRTWRDAPEIDNVVVLPELELCVGSFYDIEITQTDMYELFGRKRESPLPERMDI
jgi:ribosomal protein S12 methylthiotransferase